MTRAVTEISRKLFASLSIIGVVMTVACAKEGTATEQSHSSQIAPDSDIPDVLATVGGENITFADLKARSGSELERIETQYHMIRSKIVESALDSMVREKTIGAEAQKQGKTVDELILAEAGVGVNPTDADIEAWFKSHPDRTGGRPLDQIKPQIADVIRSDRKKEAEDRLIARLNKEKGVSVKFQPYRLTFDNASAPTKGKAGAPVTLVEFSDFQCPFCNRFAPTLRQVSEKYGDKVQIIYRQYPLTSIHPNAFKAAEASLCAYEQGKFWQLHDAMFADQTRLKVSDLKETAARLGVDRKKFDTCIETGKYVEQIQKDMSEGSKFGITGTPAVFINGVELKGGAVPFETVAAAIDKELDRAPGK